MNAVDLRACPNCGATRSKTRFTEDQFLVVECLACSLVYLGNPPPEDHLYDDYYDATGPTAALYRADSSDSSLRELYAINQQRIARLGRLKTSGRLLDIGCGRGYFLKTAHDYGYEVHGIDVSDRAVAHAQEQFGMSAEVSSLEALSGSSERYDLITLWHVLEHFVQPLDVLVHIRGLLSDDGLCAVEVPNLRSLKFMLSRTKWEGGNHPLYHRTFFSSDSLQTMLEQSGYSRVQRMRWSYEVPGRSAAYERVKRVLDRAGLDAFLDFVAWK